jgi:iron complex transport system permease protein
MRDMTKGTRGFIILLPVLIFFLSLFIGRYNLSPLTVVMILVSKFLPITSMGSATAELVLIKVRLPRVLMAMLIGAGLSISGASFQGIFKNPLVSPSLLGVSSAAGFGAVIAILFSAPPLLIQIAAMAMGIGGVFLTYFISRIYKTTPILMLILGGVIVSAFFASLISLVKYVADPDDKLPEIVFWLMGSLNMTSYKQLLMLFPCMIIGTMGLLLVSWRINILTMGEKEARSLGVNTELIKGIVIVCSTLITASAVCVSGMIGWVGLIIPHIARIFVGSDNRYVLPASCALGASYLLLIDNISRAATASEIPLGILTSIVGTPFFAYLLRRKEGGWGV